MRARAPARAEVEVQQAGEDRAQRDGDGLGRCQQRDEQRADCPSRPRSAARRARRGRRRARRAARGRTSPTRRPRRARRCAAAPTIGVRPSTVTATCGQVPADREVDARERSRAAARRRCRSRPARPRRSPAPGTARRVARARRRRAARSPRASRLHADGVHAAAATGATTIACSSTVVIVAACGIAASAPSASARPQMPSTTSVIGATRISDIVKNTVACAVKSANVRRDQARRARGARRGPAALVDPPDASAQAPRMRAARWPALRALSRPTHATGTPGGICDDRQHRVEAAGGAQAAGQRHADDRQVGVRGGDARQRGRQAGAGDDHASARACARSCSTRRPSRGRGGRT